MSGRLNGLRSICLVCLFFVFNADLGAQTSFFSRLADSSIKLSQQKVVYDLSYFRIPYPMGDVPSNKGVCTDVIIRAYRKMGIDLQREVHEDMRSNFQLYPKYWGLKTTDRNIDHRRVPNLMRFFSRKGIVLPTSNNAHDYRAGDIVCWQLPRGMKHIGLVVHQKSKDQQRPLVIHNIGDGQVIEDALLAFPVIGHYRYSK
jgi:uncharacterized protein YijF (DUF1287 family)